MADLDEVHGLEGSAVNARDPVCGMEVDVAGPWGGQTGFAGLDYGFCSESCRDRFLAEPARFAGVRPRPRAPHWRGPTYACPMHPSIVRDTRNCPICDLALEPSLSRRPA
jgi:Cu+-exporting ATPase